MSRLKIAIENEAVQTVERLYKDLERRIVASPPGICPVDLALNFLRLCHAQTCGKCVPCRIGLGQLATYLEDVLDGRATMATLGEIERLAKDIEISADCAIGTEAARMVLRGLDGFRDEYVAHIQTGNCTYHINQPVPCVALCPAGVDIPGYIALIREGRCADAVRLIRKDNPFPTACALICEHPCEARCRRNMLDSSVNIRGLKRYAVDNAGVVPAPVCGPSTGKRVAIVGGGPSGLSAAYYLQLMGHSCTVFELRPKLGGMLRYGIPNYRFPRERLQEDIDCILSTGVEIKYNTKIGESLTIDDLRRQYDAVYVSIGAQSDKKVGIEGEESKNVYSAVDLLGSIGSDNPPDFTGKRVVVIGGGNVAMDCVRSSLRLGASEAKIVYRRRKEDMTALPEEVDGALEEGCGLMQLHAPLRIEADENGNACALWAQPQIIGKIDAWGRAKVSAAAKEPVRIAADVVVVAIGQGIETRHFEQAGMSVKRGNLAALPDGMVSDLPGVFAGGDCVTGPATVIRAIAAGKVAAANIDNYLGFNHLISVDVDIPAAISEDKHHCARVNLGEKDAQERKGNFEHIECGMTAQEAAQECGRCLRCDHYGYGIFKGGRAAIW
jgi:NADPH-dependent glutamate synthase beta subunit-like oxidoreductase